MGYAKVLLGLSVVVVVALCGALLSTPILGRVVGAHVLFAGAALPLILGVIGYFTPSLTQTGAPPARLAAAPALALFAGGAAVAGLRGATAWLGVAATCGVLAALSLLAWTGSRARAALGDPHPCLRWYQAALACLILALLAVGAAVWQPSWWPALRRVHLHLNLLGFVGLTATATLHVLLPTVAGFPVPAVGAQLHRGFPYALVGTLLVAGGAGWPWLWPVAHVGAICWLVPLGRLLGGFARQRRALAPAWHGASFPLLIASVGLGLALVAGALGETLPIGRHGALALFTLAFLAPLLTGALAHLIPVWRWPGRATRARARATRLLGWGNGARAVSFAATGVAVAWELSPQAELIAGGLALLFLIQVLMAVSLSAEDSNGASSL